MSGNRIKELREAAGLTLEALAEKVDLSTSYVQRLEKEKRNLATKRLQIARLKAGRASTTSARVAFPASRAFRSTSSCLTIPP